MTRKQTFLAVIAIFGIFALALAGCQTPDGDDTNGNNNGGTAVQTVATPTATPAGGQVAANTEITLATATEGAYIYYTQDGTNPISAGVLYRDSAKPTVTVGKLTLKAIAVENGMYSSAVMTETYTISQRTYNESVRKVEFNSQMATVIFENLTYNDIYLVKINSSNKNVSAGDTGGIKNFLSSSKNRINKSFMQMNYEDTSLPLSVREESSSSSIESSSPSVLPNIGYKKEKTYSGSFISFDSNIPSYHYKYNVHSTLMAIGRHSYIWIANYQSFTKDEAPAIEEFLPEITYEQAKEIADKFDLIYPTMTNLYDIENAPNEYGDSKIIIEFYQSKEDWAGYYSGGRSIYLSSGLLRSINNTTAVMIHEFQHLINRQIKGVTLNTWFEEMLAETAKDVFSPLLGIPTTTDSHPQNRWIPALARYYYDSGSLLNSYMGCYIFGAYLMRNYGGVYLLKEIVTNDKINFESITSALNKFQNGSTFESAFSRFGEAMIFSGSVMPMGAMSFDKSFSSSINGIDYKLNGFDIWGKYSPVIYDLEPMDMPRYSIILQSSDEWKNKTGSISITLEKPVDENIELFLMVR
jgi:hypothetical protein